MLLPYSDRKSALFGSLMTVVFLASYPRPEAGIGEVIDGPGIGSTAFESARSAFLNGFHVVAAVAALICIAEKFAYQYS